MNKMINIFFTHRHSFGKKSCLPALVFLVAIQCCNIKQLNQLRLFKMVLLKKEVYENRGPAAGIFFQS